MEHRDGTVKSADAIEAIASAMALELKLPLAAIMGAAAFTALSETPEKVRAVLLGTRNLESIRRQMTDAERRATKRVELAPLSRKP